MNATTSRRAHIYPGTAASLRSIEAQIHAFKCLIDEAARLLKQEAETDRLSAEAVELSLSHLRRAAESLVDAEQGVDLAIDQLGEAAHYAEQL